MFKKIAMTTVAATALLLSMQASAHHTHKISKHEAGINKEQSQQAVMIQQGIKTCAITPSEASQLKRTQKRIAKMEKKFKHQGLSRWERKTLKDNLHAARVEINKLTKNRVTCRTKKHSKKHSKKHHHHSNRHTISQHKRGGTVTFSVRNVY